MEQRIGRIDRVNSLAEVSKNGRLRIGIPFLANDYEQFYYEKVLSRAKLFEVLMGRPDFEPVTDEEKYKEDGVTAEEVVADVDAVVTGSTPLLCVRQHALHQRNRQCIRVQLSCGESSIGMSADAVHICNFEPRSDDCKSLISKALVGSWLFSRRSSSSPPHH